MHIIVGTPGRVMDLTGGDGEAADSDEEEAPPVPRLKRGPNHLLLIDAFRLFSLFAE